MITPREEDKQAVFLRETVERVLKEAMQKYNDEKLVYYTDAKGEAQLQQALRDAAEEFLQEKN